MQNFENKLLKASNSLKILGGIFETNKVELRLKKSKRLFKKIIFGKIKN